MKKIGRTLEVAGIKNIPGNIKNQMSKYQGFYLGFKKQSQKQLGMRHNVGRSAE